MGSYPLHCLASDGQRFFLLSLRPLDPNASSSFLLTTDPASLTYSRRFVLLQSQLLPDPLDTLVWTVVDSYPPSTSPSTPTSSPASLSTNDLDVLVGEFSAGTTNCQVDALGNFVWIASKSAQRTANATTPIQIAAKPRGIRYSPATTGSTSGNSTTAGVWSLIATNRLVAQDYVWDEGMSANALFTLSQGVVVHALAASATLPGIALGVLGSNGTLVQSNQTWSLNAGVPRAMAFSNNTLFVLSTDKVLSIVPMPTSASDVVSLQTALASTTVKQLALTALADDCMNSQLASLYATAVRSSLYLLCASSWQSTPLRVFAFDGLLLTGPFTLPSLSWQANISSFTALAGPTTDVPGPDYVLLSTDQNTFSMSIGPSGFQSDTAIHMIGDTTTFNNSTSIATDTEISASTGTPASTTGGAVGGSIAFLCILALLYRRHVRNRRLRAKTDGIIGRNDNQQDHTASSPHIVLPPPLLPPRPYPVVNFQIAATEEQQDLAQIEMQRMQLGPSPATVSTSSPVVFPRAPPPAASQPEDPSFVPSTYQHAQHLNTFAHNVALPHQRQYFGIDDPNSHSIQSETPAGSSKMRLGMEKAPNPHSGYARSSSQVDNPYSIAEQSQLSPSTPSEKKNWDGDEHDDVSAALNSPPPPPYLANPTQLLNSPSAPMNNDSEHNSHNINRIP